MVTETKLHTYHGDQAVKDKLLARIGDHEQADAIVSGTYGRKVNGHYERCAVGCSLHDLTEKQLEGDLHSLYPELLGLPIWLALLEDRIFERLPKDKQVSWPRRFAEAIPVGVNFDGLAEIEQVITALEPGNSEESAAYERQADRIVVALKELPVPVEDSEGQS